MFPVLFKYQNHLYLFIVSYYSRFKTAWRSAHKMSLFVTKPYNVGVTVYCLLSNIVPWTPAAKIWHFWGSASQGSQGQWRTPGRKVKILSFSKKSPSSPELSNSLQCEEGWASMRSSGHHRYFLANLSERPNFKILNLWRFTELTRPMFVRNAPFLG